MENFTLAKYEFVMQTQEALTVPRYMGNTLRGGFGHMFKRVVCVVDHRECNRCILRHNCSYSYIFETPLPKDTEVLSKIADVPRPFVIEPPFSEKTDYESGEELRFGLVLIGKAIDFLPYFVFAFEELGRKGLGKERGRLNLLGIYSLSEKDRVQVYFGDEKILTDNSLTIRFGDLIKDEAVQRIHLEFTTPTRIQREGAILSKIDFRSFIQNLIGRISMLAYFHCGIKLELDFNDFLKRTEAMKVENEQLVRDSWHRY